MNYIAFPEIGIHLNIDPVLLALGPFAIRWYGIAISLAIFSALVLGLRQAPRFGIKTDDVIDAFMFALPISILFARLFFVIVEWDMFRNDLIGMVRIWEGGLAIYGAVIGALLTVIVFCRVRGYKVFNWMDFVFVYLPFAQAIGRWGNFFNQELYGANTTLPWGMTGSLIRAFPNPGVDGQLPVHPTFLYESLWNVLVFVLLLSLRKHGKKRGQVVAAYLFLYSIGRFALEFVRTDVFSFSGTEFRANMIAAAVIAMIGLALFILRGRTPDSPWEPLPEQIPQSDDNAAMDKADKETHKKVTPPEEVGKSVYGSVLRSLQSETQEEKDSSSESEMQEEQDSSSESETQEEQNSPDETGSEHEHAAKDNGKADV